MFSIVDKNGNGLVCTDREYLILAQLTAKELQKLEYKRDYVVRKWGCDDNWHLKLRYQTVKNLLEKLG